jgi:hypothetical protein
MILSSYEGTNFNCLITLKLAYSIDVENRSFIFLIPSQPKAYPFKHQHMMLTTQIRIDNIFFEQLETAVRNITVVHQSIFLLCSAIFLITFGITIYLIIKHRRGLGLNKKHFHKSVYIEVIWAVIPFLIIFLLVCPIFVTVFR